MGQKIFGLQPSQRDLWERAEKQGYVWVKSEHGYITKDTLSPWRRCETTYWHIFLHQKTYGINWAFTKEELE